MIQSIAERLSTAVSRYGVDAPVAIEAPSQSGFGDLASPVAFELARRLRRRAEEIAAEIVRDFGRLPGVARVEAVNGHINIWLDRAAYALSVIGRRYDQAAPAPIAPKTAHLTELRKAVIAETLTRMRGSRVERPDCEGVELTLRCRADLGIATGVEVAAGELSDTLIARAVADLASRRPEKAEAENHAVASQIGNASLRYALLRVPCDTVAAFDLQEALSFEGATGPHLQYAIVRARRLPATDLRAEELAVQLEYEDVWRTLLAISRVDWVMESGEPAALAKEAFRLAQLFAECEREDSLPWMAGLFRRELERTAGVLGIEAPAYV